MKSLRYQLVHTLDSLKSDLLCNRSITDGVGYLVWKRLDIDSSVRDVIRTKSMIIDSLGFKLRKRYIIK